MGSGPSNPASFAGSHPLAEFTQHIPPKSVHLIRYYGHYSNKARGMRKNAVTEKEQPVNLSHRDGTSMLEPTRCSQTWAMLIKRVYEADPMACPKCGSEMTVVSFIQPPQKEVIDRILEHCGLRRSPEPRAPPNMDDSIHDLKYVAMDTFLAAF